ncbi:NUDIX hydrolase [Enterococcus sp. LJL99]
MAENEVLTIFDSEYNKIGTATRAEVHAKGLWHETFHCWFYTIKDNDLLIYFQKRAAQKKDFPNLFDITAAGHLLANEPVLAGFREVKEELGIDVTSEEAEYLGIFPVHIELADFFDNEFTNVFIVETNLLANEFELQEEEVAGIFSVPLTELKKIVSDPEYVSKVEGFYQKSGYSFYVTENVQKSDFCANAATYYEELICAFEKILTKSF